MAKQITLSEFNKLYRKPNTDWKFDLFKIVCVKCGSDRVEYDGKMETGYGYYGEFDVTTTLVIKCHGCGNAFTITKTQGGSIDCNCER